MANVFLITVFILLCAYGLLIFAYWFWFVTLKPFKPTEAQPTTTFSVIIPARNEEDGIEECLLSVLENEYPKYLFEVLVIDDFSTDNTAAIIQKLQQQFANLQLINLQEILGEKPINSYKKKAIEIAIGKAKNDWIVTTDADCIANKKWLGLFDNFIQKNNPVFVAAPVMFFNLKSLVSIFQCLDFISLQGITAASVSAGVHSMCNGANLCYNKAAFYNVNGFAGIDNIASGDDMLLMHKLKQKYPTQIGYLFSQDAIIYTAPMQTWKAFINQRIRWASKATHYNDKKILAVLVLVYLLNFCLLIMPFLSLFTFHFSLYFLAFVLLKTCIEIPFMLSVAKFYKMENTIWWFAPVQPLHIAYTVVAGWLGKFGKYQWKGRTVK